MILAGLNFDEYDKSKYEHLYLMRVLDNDPLVKRVVGSLEAYIYNIDENPDKHELDKVYVVNANENNYIGTIMSKMMGDKLEISYFVSPSYRDGSFGTIMLDEYCNYLFYTRNELEKVYLQISPSNTASRVVASRVGFERDGATRYSLTNYYK